jgi:hypothetical protein
VFGLFWHRAGRALAECIDGQSSDSPDVLSSRPSERLRQLLDVKSMLTGFQEWKPRG